jgi:hypothetical protein
VRAAGRAAGTTVPRLRFVLLILVLLAGGLICLLVINTTLGATSFRISQLQSTNATLSTQEQALRQQIAAEQSPALIARRAYELGMRVQQDGSILDLRTHRFDKLGSQQGAIVPLGAPGATGLAKTSSAQAGTAKAGTAQARTGKAGTSKAGSASHLSGSGP